MTSKFFARSSHRFNRKPSRRVFRLDTLEQRTLMAVVAVDDGPFAVNEDATLSVGAPPETLIARGSTWSYLDQITNGLAPATGEPVTPLETYPLDGQGDAWFEADFDTATSDAGIGTWESAPAPLGRGTLGVAIATLWDGNERAVNNVSGVRNTVTTYLMQKKFTVSAATLASNPAFQLDLLADDAVIVYLNGTEIVRQLLPAGAVTTDQFATGSSASETYVTSTPLSLTDSQIAALLLAGPAENVISVEIHQQSATNTDSGFDLSLSAVPTGGLLANDTVDPGTQPTTLAVVTPPAHGTVTVFNNGSFNYTPAANYSGPDSFVYSVTNGVDTDTATASINVAPINDPPVARDDNYAGVEGGLVTVNSIAAGAVYVAPGSSWFYSDNGSDQDALNPEWNNAPGTGFNPSSGLEAGWVATAGAAELGYGDTDEATTVACDPDPLDGCAETPTNLDDNYITTYFWKTFDVAGAIPAQLKLGLKRDDGGIVYVNGVEVFRSNMPAVSNSTTPASGNTTSESAFFETAFDTANLGLLATGNTIAVEIHQQNAGSSDISFDLRLEDANQGLLVNDSDLESTALTVVVDDQSQFAGKGTLTVNPNGTLTFDADPGISGVFSFTYHVQDDNVPSAPSNIATATIRLRSSNASPFVANDDVFATPEDVPLVVTGNSTAGSPGGGLLANDSHPGDESDPVAITITAQPAHGTVTLDGNTGGFTYSPAANYNGPDSFTYQVDDGFGSVDTATVNLTVNAVNDPPVAANDNYTATEDTALVVTSPTVVAPIVLLPQGSTWDYLDQITNGTNATPAESYPLDGQGDAWNSAAFDIATSDSAIGAWENGSGLFALDTITCCTTATTLDGNADENTTYLFRRSLTISSADAAAIATRGLRVRYALDDGAVLYLNGLEIQRINMPAAPAAIDATTRATANGAEGTAGTNALPSSFVIDPVPIPAGTYVIAVEVHQIEPPSSDIGFDVQVEIPPLIPGILANDSDAEGDPITSIDIVPGRDTRHGDVVINPDGTFTYTPNSNYFGADQFEYTITAGGQTSTPAVVVIDVAAQNDDDPTPADDVYTVGNTQTLEATLPTFDSNRTMAGVNTLLPAGSNWFYKDDGSNQDSLNPSWKLSGFNPAAAGWSGPSAAELGFGDGGEATPITGGEITYYFANSFNLASTAGIDEILVHLRRDDGAAVYLNGNQVVLDNLLAAHPFNQLAGFQTGDENAYHTFRVPITPGMLNVGANYVAVEVHQQTTASSDVSFDLAITTPFESPTNQFGVRANDTDPDNRGTVTLAVTVPPAQHEGTFTLNNDGTFTYNPVNTFTGTDSFEYSYTTGSGTATATVTINVESSTCGLNADLNGSGNVNRADVVTLVRNFGTSTGATPAQGDIDCDGDVDLHDLSRLQSSYTGGSPSPARPSAAVATSHIASPRVKASAAVDRVLRRMTRSTQVVRATPPSTTATPSSARPLRASRAARPTADAVDSLFGSGG